MDGSALILQIIPDNSEDGVCGWLVENDAFKLACVAGFWTHNIHLILCFVMIDVLIFDSQSDKFVCRSHHWKNEFESVLAWVRAIVTDCISVTAVWFNGSQARVFNNYDGEIRIKSQELDIWSRDSRVLLGPFNSVEACDHDSSIVFDGHLPQGFFGSFNGIDFLVHVQCFVSKLNDFTLEHILEILWLQVEGEVIFWLVHYVADYKLVAFFSHQASFENLKSFSSCNWAVYSNEVRLAFMGSGLHYLFNKFQI